MAKPDDPEDQDDEPGPSSSKIPRLEHQNKVDRKKEIHYDLITKLKGEIFIHWDGYDKILGRLRGHGLTPKDIADCKESECNLFDCLERKGIIEVGKYDVLLKVLEEEGEPARKIIRTYQAKFEEISKKEVDRKKKIHYDLIAELKEYIFIKWSGYDKILGRLRGHGLTPKDIADCKESACNLFDCLERKGIIEVGKYDVLLKVLEEEGEPARKIIRTYQANFEEISRKEEDSNQEDEPGPSCSKIKKYWHKNKEDSNQEDEPGPSCSKIKKILA